MTDQNPYLDIRPIRTEEEAGRLVGAAREDDHAVIGPTHIFWRGGEIRGYLGIGRIPTVTFWADSRHLKARDSMHVIGCAEAMVSSAGNAQIITVCARSSPFHPHMERLGYQRLDADIYLKELY